jgi:hypothetical protein
MKVMISAKNILEINCSDWSRSKLKAYDNLFWDFSKGGERDKSEIIYQK